MVLYDKVHNTYILAIDSFAMFSAALYIVLSILSVVAYITCNMHYIYFCCDNRLEATCILI